MEGARWCRNKKVVTESNPKILYDIMPIVSLQLEMFLVFICYNSSTFKIKPFILDSSVSSDLLTRLVKCTSMDTP